MDDLQQQGWQQVGAAQMQAGDAVFFVGKSCGKAKYADMGGAGVHQMTATGNGTVSGSPGHGLKFEQNANHLVEARGGQMVVLRAPQLSNSVAASGGRSVMIPQGDKSIGNSPYPVRKALIPNEEARIEAGAGNAGAQYGTGIRNDAARREATSLSYIAGVDAQGKERIANTAHAARMKGANIEQRGSIQAADERLNSSTSAIQLRHEAAMKAANLNALSSVVSGFGSTISSQMQSAMQQYNRF